MRSSASPDRNSSARRWHSSAWSTAAGGPKHWSGASGSGALAVDIAPVEDAVSRRALPNAFCLGLSTRCSPGILRRLASSFTAVWRRSRSSLLRRAREPAMSLGKIGRSLTSALFDGGAACDASNVKRSGPVAFEVRRDITPTSSQDDLQARVHYPRLCRDRIGEVGGANVKSPLSRGERASRRRLRSLSRPAPSTRSSCAGAAAKRSPGHPVRFEDSGEKGVVLRSGLGVEGMRCSPARGSARRVNRLWNGTPDRLPIGTPVMSVFTPAAGQGCSAGVGWRVGRVNITRSSARRESEHGPGHGWAHVAETVERAHHPSRSRRAVLNTLLTG
jgi:hypothetical protein